MKICTKCHIEKEIDHFYFDKYHRLFRADCKECLKKSVGARQKETRQYRNEYQRKHRNLNLEKRREYHREYYKNNKHYAISSDAKRRSIKLKARPKWVSNKEMREIYKNCPKGYEVDHIVPLINKLVCGLDVPWNLQYLTKAENRAKGNKLC